MEKIWIKADKFNELDAEQFEGLSDDQKKEYHTDISAERKKEREALQKRVDELEEKDGDHDKEIVKLRKEIAEKDFSKIESLEKGMIAQGLEIKKLMEGDNSLPETTAGQIHKWIDDNQSEIAKIKEAGQGFIEMTVKVVGPMTTGSALNPDDIPEIIGVQTAPPTVVNLRATIIDDLITIFPTNQRAFAYTETIPKDGDYDFIAESETKPQIDFKIETRYAEPKKVAAHIVLTNESVEDIQNLQSIANDYLRKKHDLKRQQGLFFGDGTGENPKGATEFGRVFVAGDMLAALPSGTANIMDVINACVTDICTTHNYQDEEPYIANVAMMNKVDFFIQFVAAKTADGLPLYPMASLFNRVVIGGVLIIPFEDIPADKIFVADLKKYNSTRYIDYTVRIGFINDQLILNQFTMVGESRFHAFVKKLDEQAFIYDDISTIITAIEAP